MVRYIGSQKCFLRMLVCNKAYMTVMFRMFCLSSRLEKTQDWSWKRGTVLDLTWVPRGGNGVAGNTDSCSLRHMECTLDSHEERARKHQNNYINIKTINIFSVSASEPSWHFEAMQMPSLVAVFGLLHHWSYQPNDIDILFFWDAVNALHIGGVHVKTRNKNCCEIIFQANVQNLSERWMSCSAE